MAIFDERQFVDQDFSGIVWRDSHLTSKTFDGCIFTNCQFAETIFAYCNFVDCKFEECDLSLCRLDDSVLKQVQFDRCKLVGINWTLCEWSKTGLLNNRRLTFHECQLDFGIFMHLNLNEWVFEGCSIREADFSNAKLVDVNFADSDLRDSRFLQTDLSGADLSTAKNYTIDVRHNTIKGAAFTLPEAIALLRGLDIVLKS